MRKVEIVTLIASTPRGEPVPSSPKEYGYFFTEGEHQELLMDARCNTATFDKTIQESDDIIAPAHQDSEKWFISEKELQNSGLGHWQNRGTS